MGVWEGLLECDDVLEDPIVLGEISTSWLILSIVIANI